MKRNLDHAENGKRKPEDPLGNQALAPSLAAFRFSVFAFLLLFPLLGKASSDPSLFPDSRQRVELRPNERNPFAQQIVPEAPTTNPQEGATEEARLRRILRALKIGGVSGSPGHKQVLLGTLILKPGNTLPPIVKNQFEVLRVISVDDASVVLGFVERDSSVSSRQIILPFSVKPEVSQVMIGEALEKLAKVSPTGKIDAPPLTLQGVDDLLKGSRDADLRNLTDREVETMGVDTNAQDKKKTE
jgi:hypothetical protein